METLSVGPNKAMQLTEPLDTWLSAGLRDFAVPEAVGSSARVFSLTYTPFAGDYANNPVIKVMRPDKTQYAKPLFRNEIQILDRLKEVQGVTPMLGIGYLKTEAYHWPDEIAPMTVSLQEAASASALTGTFDLYPPEEVEAMLAELDERTAEGWLAAIILPRRWEDNLYMRADAGYTRGEFHRSYPVIEALQAGIQICGILEAAHENNVIYLDHKVLHYYWNEPRQQVFALDWNIGRIIQNDNSAEVYAFDVLQFSARALHHLLTGRQAPGSVQVGPNRPEEIQNAPEKYEPIWTYDDQKRLTEDELNVLGAAIQGKYQTPAALAEDLQTLYNQRKSQS